MRWSPVLSALLLLRLPAVGADEASVAVAPFANNELDIPGLHLVVTCNRFPGFATGKRIRDYQIAFYAFGAGVTLDTRILYRTFDQASGVYRWKQAMPEKPEELAEGWYSSHFASDGPDREDAFLRIEPGDDRLIKAPLRTLDCGKVGPDG